MWVQDDSPGCQGMTMKGEEPAFKDACTSLKSELVKGRVFADAQGRQLSIAQYSSVQFPKEINQLKLKSPL